MVNIMENSNKRKPYILIDKNKTKAILIFLICLLFFGLVTALIGKPMIDFVSEPEKFRLWVGSRGFIGKIVFVAMVFFQVVFAVIPGEPFEIGGGYAFGALTGTILCEIGIVLGTMTIFFLVRKFGVKLVKLFFSNKEIHSLKFLKKEKKRDILILLIFIIPGTPKDLLSYFIGLTDIKASRWLWITVITRLPSVVTSTVGGNALGTEKYILAIIVFSATLLISAFGFGVYKLITTIKSKKNEN